MINYTIENDYIKLKLDDINGEAKTKLRQKVLIQVYVCELHINMLEKYGTEFYMAYDENRLLHMSDSALQLIIPPQLRNITQHYKIMYGCEIFIKNGTYK